MNYGKEYYFNSIKVQLEHTAYKQDGTVDTFQFHKGTIRTIFMHV